MAVLTNEELDAYCDRLAKTGSEHAEQRAFFAWAAAAMNRSLITPLARLLFAIPNGGKRDPITAGRLKAEGVKPGVPDICWPVPINDLSCLWIELKVGNNKASDAQDSWADDLRACGHAVATCWGWRAAREAFLDYDSGEPVQTEYK